jgi:hypothetical protein
LEFKLTERICIDAALDVARGSRAISEAFSRQGRSVTFAVRLAGRAPTQSPSPEVRMGLLKRKNDSPIADAERAQLTTLRERRASLTTRLVATESDLSGAIDARRRQLLEDSGEPILNITELMDARDALTDAIREIDGKIAATEAKVLAERDRQEREAEAAKRRKQVEQVREALKAHQASGAQLAEALAPLVPVNIEIAGATSNAKIWLDGITVAVEQAIATAGGYIARVAAGNTAIIGAPIQVAPKPAPPLIVDRLPIMVLQHSKWWEDGEVKTAPKNGCCSPPRAIAEKVISLNLAIAQNSSRYLRLREIDQGEGYGQYWSPIPASDCLDLQTLEPPKPPAEQTVPTEYVGAPMTGTAVAAPVREWR